MLSAYIISLVIVAPIIASSILDLSESAISIVTGIGLLVSFVIYGMKILFEWVHVVGLVLVITMMVVGFLLSLWAVRKAPHSGTDPWQIGWTGIIVSIAGIGLALSGFTVKDFIALLPL